MNSRCRIRYIVMSMSLRLRAVCSRPATSSPHAVDDQALDVEEEILAGAVVRSLPDRVLRDRVERLAHRVRVLRRDDALRRQHHQVRVVDRHQRREEQRLGVLEVLVEDVGDVLGSECGH